MNAHELLQTIEARGGVATLTGSGRSAKISVAPRQLARELLPELQKFKPSLLELLERERNGATAKSEEAAPEEEPFERERLAASQASPWGELEDARRRLDRLEAALGTAGACRSIWRAARRLEREQPRFFCRLNASDRHALTVCVALLDANLSIEGSA